MTKKMLDSLKANPLISSLIIAAFVGTAVTGAVTGIESIDNLVMTRYEHDKDMNLHRAGLHTAAVEAIEDLKRWNRCDRLERRSNELEDRLWQLGQMKNTAPTTIRDVKKDIKRILRDFNELDCGRMLSDG